MTNTVAIQEHDARAGAVEYLKRQLGQGKSLSKLLLDAVAFENGEIVALSAAEIGPAEVTQFDWGHARQGETPPQQVKVGDRPYKAYPTPSAAAGLSGAVYDCLNGAGNLCLMENFLFEAGAPWLARARSRLLFHGSEVYHALFSVDRDKARIIDAIRDAERLPVFVGAVGRAPWPSGGDTASLHALTAEQLADFAKTAGCVFVGAYDGEGYLIWKREST